MKNAYQWILKRTTALLIAVIMMLSAVPAAVAASPDWDQLVITLSWVDAFEQPQSATAVPATVNTAEEGCFWVLLPSDAPLGALTFSAYHPMHEEYEYTPVPGTVLEEVVDADYVYVMENGKIIMKGTPREIFSRVEELKAHRLDVPQMTLLAHELRQAGLPIPKGILTREELTEAILKVR